MTCFLTYSVYGVRISAEMPTQPEVLPVITIYFYISILHTLVSMLWFVIFNYATDKEKMPPEVLRFAANLQSLASIVREFQRTKSSVNEANASSAQKDPSSDYEDKIETLSSCGDCDKCAQCKLNALGEKQKSSARKEYERKCHTFNFFVFFMSTAVMVATQLALWLSISL